MPIDTRLFLPQTKKVVKQGTFQANGLAQIPLELPGYYTELVLSVTLNLDTGTSVDPATDWDAMIIKSLKIQADNSRPFLQLDDGRELKYYDYFMAHGSLFIPDLPGESQSGVDVTFRYPIHLGDFFRNKYDVPSDKVTPPSEVIATRDLSNLLFEIGWGDANDLGTGFTINSGYAELMVSYLLLQPGVSEALAFAPRGKAVGKVGFWQPGTQVQRERNITTTYANLAYSTNFLNGFWVKDVIIMATRDDAGAGVLVLKDDVVTELRLESKDGRDLYNATWEEQKRANAQNFELPAAVTGVIHLDLREIFGADYEGIYVRNAGDLKWKFTIANVDGSNPGHIIIVYRTHTVAEARADVVGKRPAVFGV